MNESNSMTPDEQARTLEILGWELYLESGGKDSPLFRRKDWRTTKREIYYAATILEIIEVELAQARRDEREACVVIVESECYGDVGLVIPEDQVKTDWNREIVRIASAIRQREGA